MRYSLPKGVLDDLEPGCAFEAVDGSFVYGDGRQIHCDALLRAPLKGDPTSFVYVLLEHKSKYDRLLALQMVKAAVAVWERDRGAGTAKGPFPPRIVSILFHVGKSRWYGSRRCGELLGRLPLPGFGKAYFQGFDSWLLDLAQLPSGLLPPEPKLRAPLLAMRARHAAAVSDSLLDEILSGSDRGSDLEKIVIGYMIRVAKIGEKEIGMSLDRIGRGYLKPVVGSALHTAEAKGVRKGKAEGIVEGKVEGKAEVLLRLFRMKFGQLPEDAVARVRAASGEELDSWTESILYADSLGKVLASGSVR